MDYREHVDRTVCHYWWMEGNMEAFRPVIPKGVEDIIQIRKEGKPLKRNSSNQAAMSDMRQ